jgi:chromosome segregation ATPase
LSDLTKIEILLTDLETLETLVKNLIADNNRAVEERSALEARLAKVLEENKQLRKQLSSLERENEHLASGSFSSHFPFTEKLGDHEKEILVNKINDLILKVNKHLINL